MARHEILGGRGRHDAPLRCGGIYAGRDQFKDSVALMKTLGRSGAKKTAMDYGKPNQMGFAHRHGITCRDTRRD